MRGLVAELAERGLKVDYRAVWNFVHAEKLSFKKNRGGQRTRSSRRPGWARFPRSTSHNQRPLRTRLRRVVGIDDPQVRQSLGDFSPHRGEGGIDK